MIADSRRKVWEKIIKETVREASVVYNGRYPLTRFWREIASALYIPQMSKGYQIIRDPPSRTATAPSPPPPSLSSLSMLFCIVTFAFKKIKRGGERLKEDCHGRCPGEVSQPVISGNVGLWKKTLTIWNSLGNQSNAFLFMYMRFNNCIFFCSFDTGLINLSTRESTFGRWKNCTKVVYLVIG